MNIKRLIDIGSYRGMRTSETPGARPADQDQFADPERPRGHSIKKLKTTAKVIP